MLPPRSRDVVVKCVGRGWKRHCVTRSWDGTTVCSLERYFSLSSAALRTTRASLLKLKVNQTLLNHVSQRLQSIQGYLL